VRQAGAARQELTAEGNMYWIATEIWLRINPALDAKMQVRFVRCAGVANLTQARADSDTLTNRYRHRTLSEVRKQDVIPLAPQNHVISGHG
jgi:hypothetical protein